LATALKLLRANFLTLALICVFLGVAMAYRLTGSLRAIDGALVFPGALTAHASVNLPNEYQGFTVAAGTGLLPRMPCWA